MAQEILMGYLGRNESCLNAKHFHHFALSYLTQFPFMKNITQHIINLYDLNIYINSGWRHTSTQTHTRRHITGWLTPANAQVDFEVVPFCKHSDDQEVVEVDAFHQKPVTVGHDTVLHHHHSDATVNSCLQESTAELLLQMLKYQAVMLNLILCYISAVADGSSFSLWDLNFAISNLTAT